MFQILVSCKSISALINLLRGGIWPVIQFVIPLIIIILGAVDLGKAVAGGDEKKTKEAQGTFVRRVIYGVAIFFVPLIVSLIFQMVGGEEVTDEKGNRIMTFYNCWECYNNWDSKDCK